MDGAIFYSSKYGSTAQYAKWIAEATDLPRFDIATSDADPSDYDFIVLGSPIYYYKLRMQSWIKRNLASIRMRPVILFSVSGAGPGRKLDGWIAKSLPPEVRGLTEHVALRGRQIPEQLTLFDRTMLIAAALLNRDPKAAREEMRGFDGMDRAAIAPIVDLIRELQNGRTPLRVVQNG